MSSVIIIPVIILVCVIALLSAISLFARNYIKVPPNKAAIISGRRRRIKVRVGEEERIEEVGFRIVSGGATFKFPVLERVDYLDLNVFTLPITTKKAITKEGVPLSVEAVANVKIGSDDICLRNAAETLLGKEEREIQSTVVQTMEAHLRTICGTLTVESVNSDRQAFAQKVTTDAAEELKRIGIVITAFPVQHISDEQGYIDSLGKKRTAEVKRDAAIGEAEATRDATKKATDAQKEGEVQKNKNLADIAEAEKNLKVKQAQYKADADSEQARAALAGPKATAEAQKEVNVAVVEADNAKAEKEVELQKTLAQRKEEELKVIVVKVAEAEKQKKIIEAEAEKQATILKAEGEKGAEVTEAEGIKSATELKGAGEAAKIKAIKFADAEGDAAIIEKKGKAEGEAIKAKLLAEAEGLEKKAEAYKALDDAARFQFILEKAPSVIEAIGEAAAKALGPAFDSVGRGMANIDKVVIVETGNGDGKGGVTRFATTAPTVFFQVLQQARAVGIDPTKLFAKLGIDVVKEMGLTKSDSPGEMVPEKSGDK